MDCEAAHIVLTLNGHDRRFSPLGDDRRSLPLVVLLWQVGQVLGNLWNVLGLEVMRFGVCHRLALVADHVVPVRRSLVKLIFEKLRNEGCR